ncbi:MAG TPA: DUF3592 domain-containing protein [Anaerolineales bacterium]|nr:DUF3592 domain-containing protein [Anaerolineales bacterium]
MKISALVFAVIGVLLLGLGGFLGLREQNFLRSAEQASAVVTENIQYTYTGQVNEYGVQHYFCSKFQLQTRAGQTFTYEENDADCADLDSPPHYQVGQRVTLYFDPSDPVKTLQTPTMVDIDFKGAELVAGAGVLSTLLGLGLFLIGRFRRSQAASSR